MQSLAAVAAICHEKKKKRHLLVKYITSVGILLTIAVAKVSL